jgi:hypothetical protein
MSVLPNGTKSSGSNALTIMTLKSKFQKVNPGLPEAVTRVSNVGNQLTHWPCIAKKPAFMLIHEFMQRRTQLFSYLDSAPLHWTIELPTLQEKIEQIFFVQPKAHHYKFRDKHDCLPPYNNDDMNSSD